MNNTPHGCLRGGFAFSLLERPRQRHRARFANIETIAKEHGILKTHRKPCSYA